MEKEDFIEKIKYNIDVHGYHVTIVTGSPYPRFMYTIGLKNKIGCELIFAGGESMSAKIVNKIFREMYNKLSLDNNEKNNPIDLDSLGTFIISEVDPSWSKLLTLGVFDFYQTSNIKILQILPNQLNITLDIPHLDRTFNVNTEPIWKWLTLDWTFPVPRNSIVITNVDSLYGQKTTEATRWEEAEWEIFVGSGLELDKEKTLIVPLGTMLGIDNTLEPVVNLQINKGIWRDPIELIWHNWN